MGNGTKSPYRGQVYYDNGGYYTQRPLSMANPVNYSRTYLDRPATQSNGLSPMASALIQQAMASTANAPSLASLFPSLGQGLNMGNPEMGNYTGQWGAGRFLAPNASQFGGQTGIMGGFAPNANTTT